MIRANRAFCHFAHRKALITSRNLAPCDEAFEVPKNTAWRVAVAAWGANSPRSIICIPYMFSLLDVYAPVCMCVRAYELPRICGFSENLEYSVVCCARQRSSKSFATLRYLGQHDIKTFTKMQLRRILSSCASNLS